MSKGIIKALRSAAGAVAAVGLLLAATADGASAQNTRTIKGKKYVPTIWIDPDGCEHWVMDDGWEGYGENRIRRDGTPVCHDVNVCGVVNTDQFFKTDSYRINASGRARLEKFFKESDAFAFSVIGHTDSRASDEYNMRLSLNRANSVAKIGKSTGARIIDVRGYGERKPAVPNTSAANMAKNRRVEILCFR
ncbi:OmpA family protein [Shimia biformata]|uniref:OmpA family protein n=1 Tax=Shimia biformata TaxID=1294299 RepID=UPI0019515E26